jgi:hypothetical protein
MFFASKESQMMSQRTGWFDNDTAIIHLWMIKGTIAAAPAGHVVVVVVVVSARCCQNVEKKQVTHCARLDATTR